MSMDLHHKDNDLFLGLVKVYKTWECRRFSVRKILHNESRETARIAKGQFCKKWLSKKLPGGYRKYM
jgi:hypothetical protein